MFLLVDREVSFLLARKIITQVPVDFRSVKSLTKRREKKQVDLRTMFNDQLVRNTGQNNIEYI